MPGLLSKGTVVVSQKCHLARELLNKEKKTKNPMLGVIADEPVELLLITY